MTTRSLFAVLTTVGLLTHGNISSPAPKSGSFSTAWEPVGGGAVRAYVDIQEGRAIALGVALTADALETLSTELITVVLPLPIDNPTPYRHVTVSWHPGSHDPLRMYDSPHLDLRFYTITNAERVRIDPVDPLFATKAANDPGSAFIPPGYVAPTAKGTPSTGVHWVDASSPELNGERFTHAFHYGSWDGRIVLAEPMVTRTLLESRIDVTADVRVAGRHWSPGQYPGQYRIHFDSTTNEHRVALLGFAHRN